MKKEKVYQLIRIGSKKPEHLIGSNNYKMIK